MLTDNRCKQLMNELGMPDSKSLYGALHQVANETEQAVRAEVRAEAQESSPWIEGCPHHPWDQEWFIAMTTYGDKVVLKALPEEFTYDFKTADDTYIKKESIKAWMQFPDSEYIAATQPPVPPSDQATFSATEIAVYLAAKFYPGVTQWKPLDNLVGVLTQIDNMVAGIAAPAPCLAEHKCPPSTTDTRDTYEQISDFSKGTYRGL